MTRECPYCGSTRLAITPEGRIVCERCGAVITDSLIVSIYSRGTRDPRRGKRSRPLTVRVRVSTVRLPVRPAPQPELDPIDRIALETIRANKSLSLGRKPTTLAALARVSRLIAEGYTLRTAVREAARRYNVSERTLLDLARKYRRAVITAAERVVEAWSRSTRENSRQ